mmetsp:Transcript_34332/g.51465  ORF Transcript_34332/g.51465 Transcript_34332/m.51465 type:complete len:94 (-) Transcript_34332:151-432(-)
MMMWGKGLSSQKKYYYQAERRRLLDEEAASTLQLALPRDIVMNNVLPFSIAVMTRLKWGIMERKKTIVMERKRRNEEQEGACKYFHAVCSWLQ